MATVAGPVEAVLQTSAVSLYFTFLVSNFCVVMYMKYVGTTRTENWWGKSFHLHVNCDSKNVEISKGQIVYKQCKMVASVLNTQ